MLPVHTLVEPDDHALAPALRFQQLLREALLQRIDTPPFPIHHHIDERIARREDPRLSQVLEVQPFVQVIPRVRRLYGEGTHPQQYCISPRLHPERPLLVVEVIRPIAFQAQAHGDGLALEADLRARPIVIVLQQDAFLQGLLALRRHRLKLREADVEIQCRQVVRHRDFFDGFLGLRAERCGEIIQQLPAAGRVPEADAPGQERANTNRHGKTGQVVPCSPPGGQPGPQTSFPGRDSVFYPHPITSDSSSPPENALTPPLQTSPATRVPRLVAPRPPAS